MLHTKLLFIGTVETLYMTFVSGFFAVLIGLPLGIFVHTTRAEQLYENVFWHRCLSSVIDILRSIPFIILIVAVIPLTRLIVGTSVGNTAAIVPLTLGAAPFMARVVSNALHELPKGLTEVGRTLGASRRQIILKICLMECLPSLIQGVTLMLITLVAYSAMAGAVGAGGLGEIAIDYGYQRFDTMMMLSTVIILVLLVQLIQWGGDRLTKHFMR